MNTAHCYADRETIADHASILECAAEDSRKLSNLPDVIEWLADECAGKRAYNSDRVQRWYVTAHPNFCRATVADWLHIALSPDALPGARIEAMDLLAARYVGSWA